MKLKLEQLLQKIKQFEFINKLFFRDIVLLYTKIMELFMNIHCKLLGLFNYLKFNYLKFKRKWLHILWWWPIINIVISSKDLPYLNIYFTKKAELKFANINKKFNNYYLTFILNMKLKYPKIIWIMIQIKNLILLIKKIILNFLLIISLIKQIWIKIGLLISAIKFKIKKFKLVIIFMPLLDEIINDLISFQSKINLSWKKFNSTKLFIFIISFIFFYWQIKFAIQVILFIYWYSYKYLILFIDCIILTIFKKNYLILLYYRKVTAFLQLILIDSIFKIIPKKLKKIKKRIQIFFSWRFWRYWCIELLTRIDRAAERRLVLFVRWVNWKTDKYGYWSRQYYYRSYNKIRYYIRRYKKTKKFWSNRGIKFAFGLWWWVFSKLVFKLKNFQFKIRYIDYWNENILYKNMLRYAEHINKKNIEVIKFTFLNYIEQKNLCYKIGNLNSLQFIKYFDILNFGLIKLKITFKKKLKI